MDSVGYRKLLIISINLTIILTHFTLLHNCIPNDGIKKLQILCIDMEDKPLDGAEIVIRNLNGKIICNGTTNSTGWICVELPQGKYILEILWLKTPVYRGNISLTNSPYKRIRCKVYHLTVTINLLYIIPIRHAKITILNKTTQKTVYTYVGEIKIPYRLYVLSAEKTIRLPAGNYTVIVEMLNKQVQEINLNKSIKIVFPYIISYGSLFILTCIIIAIISCLCFLITGRKHIKD